MASEDRSLNSGGISIPQWMKGKISENRFDLDQNTFSPPENDDSFLYIRYPQIIKSVKAPAVVQVEPKVPSCEVDYINHTGPCKESIINPGYKPQPVLLRTQSDIKIKSNGTDDGFKGEGAACGSSVVRVAHQMISGKYPNHNPVDDDPLRPKGFKPAQRRGSRSLPASPQTSPKNKRKLVANKYFTGAFVDNENHSGGWILQGLLGKRELSQSIGLISEESVGKSDLEKSVTDLHINDAKIDLKIKEFKTKPSEFREMNFWSPTSM